MDAKSQKQINKDAISLFFLPASPRRMRSERAAWCTSTHAPSGRFAEYANTLRAELRRLHIDATVPRVLNGRVQRWDEHRGETLWRRAAAMSITEWIDIGGLRVARRYPIEVLLFNIFTDAEVRKNISVDDLEATVFAMLHPELAKASCSEGFRCAACCGTGVAFDDGMAA